MRKIFLPLTLHVKKTGGNRLQCVGEFRPCPPVEEWGQAIDPDLRVKGVPGPCLNPSADACWLGD